MKDLIKHLKEAAKQLDELGHPESDVQTDAMHAASIVKRASELARKYGYRSGKLPFENYEGQTCMSIQDAKSVIGGLQVWCDEQEEQQIQSNDGWMTIDHAAKYLRISVSSLRKIVARARCQKHPDIKFRQVKRGARLMFRREWLDDYLRRDQVVLGSKPKRNSRRRQQPPQAPQSSHGLDSSLID